MFCVHACCLRKPLGDGDDAEAKHRLWTAPADLKSQLKACQKISKMNYIRLTHAKLSVCTVTFVSYRFSTPPSSPPTTLEKSLLLYLHISDHLPARSIQQDMHRYTLESVHLSEEQAGTGSYSLHLPCSLHTNFYLLAQINFKQLTGVSLHAPEVQHFFFSLRNHTKIVCLCKLCLCQLCPNKN